MQESARNAGKGWKYRRAPWVGVWCSEGVYAVDVDVESCYINRSLCACVRQDVA